MPLFGEINPWKEKAVKRRLENKALKKEVKQLEFSRNKWRNKVDLLTASNKKIEDELKKKLLIFDGDKPKGYGFMILIIKDLMEHKLKTSISFRALALSFCIRKETMQFECKTPTHTTLLNWIHKIGYYQLIRTKEKADDWIIILDESIQLGQDKVLVIFGIREKDIDFSRPLRFQDLSILTERVRKTWTGDLINLELDNLKKELGCIKYAVGDYGSDLKKGLRLANIPHVHDITHKIALLLEKMFKNNTEYLELTKQMSEMRIKCAQTKAAYIIPPKQRVKSRYQNIKIISGWCRKIIRAIENGKIKDESYDKVKWILKYKQFIEDLSELNSIICDVEKIFKHNGFSKSTGKECSVKVEELKTDIGISFKEKFKEYLIETENLLPNVDKMLMTSDIIESAFGKYKNYVSLNPMAGITNLILCIAAFTSSLDESEIKEALETTTINDIKKWTNEFVGKTLYQKRREVLSCA